MLRKIAIGVVALTLMLIAVSCSGTTTAITPPATQSQLPGALSTPTSTPAQIQIPNTKPNGPVKGTWVDVQTDGDTISIPLTEIINKFNIHFKVPIQNTTETFMAYLLDGVIIVRANVCPPCRSIGYTLDKDILVCDMCATTFKAKTGDGIQGACVNYPKAAISYKIEGNKITLARADLVTAYNNTLKPGWP